MYYFNLTWGSRSAWRWADRLHDWGPQLVASGSKHKVVRDTRCAYSSKVVSGKKYVSTLKVHS